MLDSVCMQARMRSIKNALADMRVLAAGRVLFGSLASCIITPHFRATARQQVEALGRSEL
jgi:hypothetical protein